MNVERQTGLEDDFHPPLEMLPLIGDSKRFLGNFVRTKPQQLNAFFSCEHYLSDGSGLRPLVDASIGDRMQVVVHRREAQSDLEVMAEALVGERAGEGLTTRDLVKAGEYIEGLNQLSTRMWQFAYLKAFEDLTFKEEVDYLKRCALAFGDSVRAEDVWLVGRYHEEGVTPDSPELRDPFFAARVIGFEFDKERSVLLPVVLNAQGTRRGLLPPNLRLGGDATGSWLYVRDETLRARQPLFIAPTIEGVDEALL